MTQTKDIEITIGRFKLRLGDIRCVDGKDLILKNGMRIKKDSFTLKTENEAKSHT